MTVFSRITDLFFSFYKNYCFDLMKKTVKKKKTPKKPKKS